MPREHVLAKMLRADLLAARAKWIEAAGEDLKEKVRRIKSDFLAAVNHEQQRAVFYSTRHGHGTALADAGVAEKDIAASMHHSNRSTTARYLHTSQRNLAAVMEVMPDLSISIPGQNQALATGTTGEVVDCLSTACPTQLVLLGLALPLVKFKALM